MRRPFGEQASQRRGKHPAPIKAPNGQEIQHAQKAGGGRHGEMKGSPHGHRHHCRRQKQAGQRPCRAEQPLLSIGKHSSDHLQPRPQQIQPQGTKRDPQHPCRRQMPAFMNRRRKQHRRAEPRSIGDQHRKKQNGRRRADPHLRPPFPFPYSFFQANHLPFPILALFYARRGSFDTREISPSGQRA